MEKNYESSKDYINRGSEECRGEQNKDGLQVIDRHRVGMRVSKNSTDISDYSDCPIPY